MKYSWIKVHEEGLQFNTTILVEPFLCSAGAKEAIHYNIDANGDLHPQSPL
jgi:hypothetical protein